MTLYNLKMKRTIAPLALFLFIIGTVNGQPKSTLDTNAAHFYLFSYFLKEDNGVNLAVSTDGANTWSIKTITDLPDNSLFLSTSCTGNWLKPICIAVGAERHAENEHPLIAFSTDGGPTWKIERFANSSLKGIFFGSGTSGVL